jgi:predicted transglutaminase-like cysteine proteinase
LAKKADINAPYAGGWEEFVQKNQSADKLEMIKKVNETFNSMRYVPDQKNWGVPDLWNTPVQFTQSPDYVVPGRVSGDCEDHAIAKYYALQKLGFTQDELRILVVKDLNLGVGHCILGVITAGQCFILDNQIKSVWTADKIQHYKPIYAINETAWWQFVPAGQAAPAAAGAGGGGADQGD